uniref:Uncharacterized protein n=1 Tax=Marseillevirus LCMAC101 TaxID=2506602 RepID=A0A481YRZ4_9VIRU|nr:MAG: hypothetical protein LCMAC101_06180 [Marseillevirus LCMAC101]
MSFVPHSTKDNLKENPYYVRMLAEYLLLNAKSALNMYKYNENLKEKYFTLDKIPEMMDRFRQLYCVDIGNHTRAIIALVIIGDIQSRQCYLEDGLIGDDPNKRRLTNYLHCEDLNLKETIETLILSPYLEERFPQPTFNVSLKPHEGNDYIWILPRVGDILLSSNNSPGMTFFLFGIEDEPVFARTGSWWKPVFLTHPLISKDIWVIILDEKDHIVKNTEDFVPTTVQAFIETDERGDIVDRIQKTLIQ